MKKLNFILAPFIINMQLAAQENYEIQVYASQTQQKRSTIFELHSNFTFKGEKKLVDGVRPTHNALHETVEITHGIGNNFEIGVYLFTNHTPHYGYQVVGTHIRPRIMAPLKWNLPVGLSLSTEIGYQRPEYAAETWSIELRPIVDKQWNKFYLSFNPTLGIPLKTVDSNKTPVFAPNIKTTYAFFSKWSLGIEYYGELGPLNAFKSISNQDHALFAVLDLINKDWEFNAGAGFGLTPATEGFIFKVILGRRIFWKKKS